MNHRLNCKTHQKRANEGILLLNRTKKIKKMTMVKGHELNASTISIEENLDKSFVSQGTFDSSPKVVKGHSPILSIGESARATYLLLIDLTNRCQYGIDTFWSGAQLLKSLPFEGSPATCKRIAAAILNLASKLNEHRKSAYNSLIIWGDYQFTKEELVDTEAQILEEIDFDIVQAPTFTFVQLQQKCLQLEQYFTGFFF